MPGLSLTPREMRAFQNALGRGTTDDDVRRIYETHDEFRSWLNALIHAHILLASATQQHYIGPFNLTDATLERYVTKLLLKQPIDDFLDEISEPIMLYSLDEIRQVLMHLHNTAITIRGLNPNDHGLPAPYTLITPDLFLVNVNRADEAGVVGTKNTYTFYLISTGLLAIDLHWIVNGAPYLLESPALLPALHGSSVFLSAFFTLPPCFIHAQYEKIVRAFSIHRRPSGTLLHHEQFEGIYQQLRKRLLSFEKLEELLEYRGAIDLHAPVNTLLDPTVILRPIWLWQSIYVGPALYPLLYGYRVLENNQESNFEVARDYLSLFAFVLLYIKLYNLEPIEVASEYFYCINDSGQEFKFCMHDYMRHCLSAFAAMATTETIRVLPEITQLVYNTAKNTCTQVTSWAGRVAPYLRGTQNRPQQVVDVESGRRSAPHAG